MANSRWANRQQPKWVDQFDSLQPQLSVEDPSESLYFALVNMTYPKS